MDIELVVTKGLGDNSYVVASGDEAAVVDPQRDVERYLAVAERRGWSIRHVLETHVHNDYVSGAVELRERTGARLGGPAGAGYRFPFEPMSEGDHILVGDLRLVAMGTPGHTPEHTSYLAFEGDAQTPAAAFTGGSLMVGGAGRTDLLGEEMTDELTRFQYRSLRRLAALPGDVRVLPTHGAGSFCGTGRAPKQRDTTVEEEIRGNGALAAPDEDAFVRQQLSSLLAYPPYYREMAAINRAGPRVLASRPQPPALSADEVTGRLDAAAWLIDGRARLAFAGSHVPGSLNVELDDAFASYVGWLVPFNAPLVLVVPDPEAEAAGEAALQLIRIGYERVLGYLEGGIEAWRSAGRSVGSYQTASVEDLCAAMGAPAPQRPAVLDVRQRVEWDGGHIPGSAHVFVGDLPARLGGVPRDREVWTICASGHRSSMAASLLDRAGIPVRLVARGGVRDWLAACGERA